MNQFVEHIKLTDQERAEMRANLRHFMAEYPVRWTFIERFFAKTPSTVPGVTFMRPAFAVLLIVLLAGGGTTYAAADALPGDVLYSVKTKINEPIAGAFATSLEAKANWSATLAARRLEEAGALAIEGRLTPEARAVIEENFDKQTKEFEENATALASASDHIEAAADAQSYMEVSLKAYVDVLTELSRVVPIEENELAPILETLQSRARSVESARIATEGVIAAREERDIKAVAEAKRKILEKEVAREKRGDGISKGKVAVNTVLTKEVPAPAEMVETPEVPQIALMMNATVSDEATFTEKTSTTSVEEETQMQVVEEVLNTEEDEVREAFREGSLKFEEGKNGEAYTAFQKALRAVERKRLDVDVRKRLNLDKFNIDLKEETSDPER